LPSDRDYEFARLAVELTLLTRDQADALLADLRAAESLGAGDSLPQMAVNRGLISAADCRALSDRVGRALGQRAEIAGFELLEKIGQGGMGTVYRARQLSMGRVIALKVLSRRLARNETYVRRFFREARAAAKLNHPNIVQGIDVGKSGGYYYFAMEYINGETVAEKIAREGPLPEAEALAVCAQVAHALEHAHSRANIIHRDVKPQNILIDPSGTAKLADLGLAREAIRGDAAVTFSGVTLGTPDYISPEQIRGEVDLDGRCDVYSLGATLFHMVTGKPPFTGQTANVTMAKHLTDMVPDPSGIRPGISPGTTAIIRRAMQKDKESRYQTAEEMARAIEAQLHKLIPPEAPAHEPPPMHRPRAGTQRPTSRLLAAALVCGGAAALIALVIFLATRGGGPRPAEHGVQPPVEPPKDIVTSPPKLPKLREIRPGASAYELAQELGRKNKARLWTIISDLRDLLEECHETEYESAVSLLLDQATAELRITAGAKLGELEDRANALCLEKKYGAAIAEFQNFPDDLRVEGWDEKLAEAKRRVVSRAARAFEQSKLAAADAADAHDFDRAIAIMEDAARWGVPGFRADALRLAAALRDEKARQQTLAETRRFSIMIAHAEKVFSALRDREYAAARAAAAEAAHDARLGDDAEKFRQLQADIKHLESLWRDAELRLRTMKPGDNVRLDSILRKFVKFENGVVTAQVAGQVKTLALKAMRDVDLFELLAAQFAGDGSDPGPYLKRGLFYTFDRFRNLDKAVKDFDAAEKRGARAAAARGREYIQLFIDLEPERAAIRLLVEARAAAEQQLWKKLNDKLKELAKYGETEACRRHAAELTELALLAAGKGRGLSHLFSGETRLEGADGVTITYDFRKEAHRLDWRGGSPGPRGLRCDRQLRWSAGVRVDSIRLDFTMPAVRTELRLMCTPQGDRPEVAAGFGWIRARRWYLVGEKPRQAGCKVRPGTDATLEVVILRPTAKLGAEKPKARAKIGGEPPLEVAVRRHDCANRSIFLVTDRPAVDVARVVIRGRLDLEWARRRAAELADIAESTLLATVEVSADKEWTETGIVLESGERYHLRARGWWNYGRSDRLGTSAAGEPRLLYYMPIYSLVAQVAAAVYSVGEEKTLGPFVSGRLRLGMNDVPGGHKDNSGKMTVEIRRLPRRAASRAGVAPGLLGFYYSGTNFNKLERVKIDPAVDWDRARLAKSAGRNDGFSVRWEGYIKVSQPGSYAFGIRADDGFRVWVDGKKLMERWRPSPLNRARTAPVLLDQGLHEVKVEYFQAGGDAFVHLWWRRAGARRRGRGEVVPPGVFFHSRARAQQVGLR